MKKLGLSLLGLGLIVFSGAGTAHALTTTGFDLAPRNAACLPNAAGHVTVFHKEDALGVDTLRLTATGLPADTEFTVFLTSADAFSTPPFGTTEYIGDFTTNAAGIGSLQVDALIHEAFVTTVAGTPPTRGRADLDHLVIWFADPSSLPGCAGTTSFDGDGVAGPAALSSQGSTGLEELP
ncbi:MAG TPA: hypothetical protein VKH46_11675 [Thermoanaerobaculia bacterium]|nr:hypothetical protein [Thermoanaerobaculia bacterium]